MRSSRTKAEALRMARGQKQHWQLDRRWRVELVSNGDYWYWTLARGRLTLEQDEHSGSWMAWADGKTGGMRRTPQNALRALRWFLSVKRNLMEELVQETGRAG